MEGQLLFLANSKYASPAYNNFDGHSYYKDFTYVQIKNITLGYNFEKNFVKKLPDRQARMDRAQGILGPADPRAVGSRDRKSVV